MSTRKSQLVKSSYHGVDVFFREDGWFNATQAAEKFGKRPSKWLELPSTKEYIAVLKEESDVRKLDITFRGNSRTQQQGTWFHPALAVPFARWLDVRFGIWCDQQIRQLLTGDHPHTDWKRLRHAASASYAVMMTVLELQRQFDGKPTGPHHYINEARLINHCLAGEFASINRDTLGPIDLDLLGSLEAYNTVLLAHGYTYEERKASLLEHAARKRRPALLAA